MRGEKTWPSINLSILSGFRPMVYNAITALLQIQAVIGTDRSHLY
jgi:hypothetical protein